MSLNKDTLELIVAQAAAAQQLPPTLIPISALPGNVEIHNLEKYQAGRLRFRGTLKTSSLADFVTYTTGRSRFDAQGFVNPDAMTCTVFFNLGTDTTPGHADDIAILTLNPTAAYKALQQIAGKKLTQRELAEWIEDWHHLLTATKEDGKEVTIAEAVNSVRNITIKASASASHNESNFGASRSAMDTIEANATETRLESLTFKLVPYEGLAERKFILRLSILTGDDKPTLKLRWVGEEVQIEEIAQDFKAVLAKDIGTAATLTLGTFSA
ncbi:DUF2303 family protein [Pseudomonas chlororaphis]|uniref:DUF2303 family protein n=1 Tax=Pseudomonas chlororaphis TaxID=587753 RepID=UPI000F57C143|nr:DUF2303 family protein [Pseudomonas chlororaphis]AZC55409.1 Uncharacterized protein YfdQ [Pseudomonas chlororaphis subsp. piscium]